MLKINVLICVFIFSISNLCLAQYEKNYAPKSTYNENSKDLIKQVRKQLDSEIKDVGSLRAQKIFRTSTEYLITLIKQRAFLNDDTLQRAVKKVFDKLLSTNKISSEGKTILTNKSPDINAICFGEGSFFVTVGLLRKIDNEGQLAFTIAHELAHYQLGHVKKKVLQMAETNEQKAISKEVDRIVNGTVTTEGLEKLKTLSYNKNRFSRDLELEADSLGFVLYQNAGYNPMEALQLIDQLDFSNYSKLNLGKKLFLPFHFRKFPFQEKWLNDRLSIYKKETQKSFIFDNDSIKSHPDFEIRKEKLSSYIDKSQYNNEQTVKDSLLIQTAELEALESALFVKKLDVAMFLALELKSIYPENDFINTRVVNIFLDAHEARENQVLNYYVPNFTSTYHTELRKVNNFLHNVSKKDLIEIAFHFLNQKTNFNQSNQDHYYLLWELAGKSKRISFQQKIIEAYMVKFPNGKYKNALK